MSARPFFKNRQAAAIAALEAMETQAAQGANQEQEAPVAPVPSFFEQNPWAAPALVVGGALLALRR